MSRHIRVDIASQRLTLFEDDRVLRSYAVSTARNGPGERRGSECTPTGAHVIRLKIGADCPENTVFVARRPTGEIYSADLAQAEPGRDWILTRILWLSGRAPGHNRGGERDSLRRYIYIHGTPDSEAMGVARSHGCIRMRNSDLIELFELVDNGCPVDIEA